MLRPDNLDTLPNAEVKRVAGFGENLRREREMRGISIEEISDTTKISVRFLQALERDDFGKLPGGIFIRSFIRSYAAYLGLDPEAVLAEFQLASPAREDEDFSRIGVTATSPRKRFSAPVLPWIVAVLLLAGGYAIYRYSHPAGDASLGEANPSLASKSKISSSEPQTATSSPAVLVSAPRPEQATVAATQIKPGAEADSTAASKIGDSPQNPGTRGSVVPPPGSSAPPSHGELSLRLLASEQSWVDVKADGRTLVERVMAPNEVLNLSAKDSFDVVTGNAAGIVLTLNGVLLRPLGGRGEVKAVHLTAADISSANP